MYRVLRSRQAINEPSTIYRQRFSTCIAAYRAPRSFPLLCHASSLDGYRTIPQYASPSEQKRNFGGLALDANHKHVREKGLFCSNSRSIVSRSLAKSARRQTLNQRSLSYSRTLCVTEFQEPRIDSVLADSENQPKLDSESSIVRPNIRERMRIWEAANSAGKIEDLLADLPKPGQIENRGMRGALEGYLENPQPDNIGGNNGTQLLFDQGELVDLGDNRPFLLKGDMVELKVSNQRKPELAICIRQFREYVQFYTMSGKWVNRNSSNISFYVPRFVVPEAVDGLLPYLPSADSPPTEQNKLQIFSNALPREIGAPLVEKMLKFWHQTQEAYRNSADSLDRAYQTMASDNVLHYYTLQQIASKLLPHSVKLPNGEYPTPTLYAVHRAVSQNNFGFRSFGANHRHGSRSSSRYEVIPKIDSNIVDKVTDYVRKFQEKQASKKKVTEDGLPLAKFIIKTQRLINISRKHREVTKSGILGPYQAANDQCDVSSTPSRLDGQTKFTDTDIEIIRFMESWVAMRHFEVGSAAYGIGSLILRSIRRYDGFTLDPTTAWTFLQEIGILAPWDNRVAFDLRLPKTGFQLSVEENPSDQVAQKSGDPPLKDRMEALRRDWASMPVYCVDNANAQEIDDGVSLERIEDNPDEYWVHIHTADPASHIEPSSDLAKNAEQMVGSVYLPERKVSMLPKGITSSLFSLANGRPSLTFSAKMNDAGDILDTKVSAGYVRNVKFTTPAVLDEIVSGTVSPRNGGKSYTVGGSMLSEASEPNSGAERNLLQASELANEDKENLRKLSALGIARRQKGVQRGAIPEAASSLIHARDPSISVRLNEEVLKPSSYANYYSSDPTIEVICNDDTAGTGMGVTTVTNLMLLAGEISGRWCHARGIPIPYRVSPQNPEQPDPAKYLREVVLPALEHPGEATRRLVENYLFQIGRVALSTTPGPHLALGVSKFTKCTSPLRRYPDLLVHWQVEAALLEEARTSQSLLGSTREDYLPFSSNSIEDLMPQLDDRERSLRKAHKMANYSWAIQFILRAWKFKECAIPQTFECQIRQIRMRGRKTLATARINFLGIDAQLELPDWINEEQIDVGDTYECEFSHVDLYLRSIELKPLRRISKAADGLDGVGSGSV